MSDLESRTVRYRPPAIWDILTESAKDEILNEKAARYGREMVRYIKVRGQLTAFLEGEIHVQVPCNSPEFVSFWHPRDTASRMSFMQQALATGLAEEEPEALDGCLFAAVPVYGQNSLIIARDFYIAQMLRDAGYNIDDEAI